MTPAALSIDAVIEAGSFTVQSRFEAAPGITALFGPSGSGKSVTLAAIAGLLRPSSGMIVLDSRVVADADRRLHVPTQARSLGMVFQQPALLPHRSPLDNVALAVRDQPHRAARTATAHRWLARVSADHLADAPTISLSGGEQQRVALARALAGGPRFLLLDEPFSALDQPTRTALRTLVSELVAEHRITAIVVTHDLDDIVALATQVVLFEPGRSLSTHTLAGNDRGKLADILGLTAGPAQS
jgi:molybdate transport system ATP-binding protein